MDSKVSSIFPVTRQIWIMDHISSILFNICKNIYWFSIYKDIYWFTILTYELYMTGETLKNWHFYNHRKNKTMLRFLKNRSVILSIQLKFINSLKVVNHNRVVWEYISYSKLYSLNSIFCNLNPQLSFSSLQRWKTAGVHALCNSLHKLKYSHWFTLPMTFKRFWLQCLTKNEKREWCQQNGQIRHLCINPLSLGP